MKKKCKACGEYLDLCNFAKNKLLKDGYENKCKKCRQAQRRMAHKHICQQCNCEFTSAKKKAKYCSPECQGLARRNRVFVKCKYCGHEFEVVKSRTKYCENIFCGNECFSKYLSETRTGENNHNYRRVEVECSGCSTPIKIHEHRLKHHKYHFCSKDCYKANIGKFVSGENNPFWNPDLSDEERINRRINNSAHKEWRKRVFERDNYTCQCCGDNSGGNLNAHHILNYSEYEDLRYDINNGITLCEDCHFEFHLVFGFRNNNKEQLEIFFLQKRYA